MASHFQPTMFTPSNSINGQGAAVSRSEELLSCARTALKIAKRQNVSLPNQQQQQAWWEGIEPASLRLHDLETFDQDESLEDGLSLLRAMEDQLRQLEGLVKRRGHTNDPTDEIARLVQQLEGDASELNNVLQTLIPPTARGQRYKHWQILQQWFQQVAKEQGEKLQRILKIRSQVVAEQTRRRQQFRPNSQKNNAVGSNGYAKTNNNLSDNPLFKIPVKSRVKGPSLGPGSLANGQSSHMSQANGHGQSTMSASSSMPTSSKPAMPKTTFEPNAYSYYGGANNGYGSSGGYGGAQSMYGGSQLGMRQRKGNSLSVQSDEKENDASLQQEQLLIRQQERQTQQRLAEAQQAEKSLAELGTLFGKMSSLITQQSEVIDNIEDDVEAAMLDVNAGHSEIQTVYSIKKGNRSLIIKVFSLLIFLIIFMRVYRK